MALLLLLLLRPKLKVPLPETAVVTSHSTHCPVAVEPTESSGVAGSVGALFQTSPSSVHTALLSA